MLEIEVGDVVSAKSNMGIGAAIFVVGGLVTLGSRGHLVAWGAILFGALQFLLGLSQSGSDTSGKLGEILPEGNDTQRAICAALCGVVANPQQPSEQETQHIQSLLAQVQFPQTAERIHAVARAVAERKGGLLGVLHDMSNAIHPPMRPDIVAGAFLVMRTGGRQADMERVYAIGKAVFLEREKVDAAIAPYNKSQPGGDGAAVCADRADRAANAPGRPARRHQRPGLSHLFRRHRRVRFDDRTEGFPE